jgi:hypothetical protein
LINFRISLWIAAIRAPAGVDTELLALYGNVALHTEALGEFALLDQVAGRQEEVGLAVDECQQVCPLNENDLD